MLPVLCELSKESQIALALHVLAVPRHRWGATIKGALPTDLISCDQSWSKLPRAAQIAWAMQVMVRLWDDPHVIGLRRREAMCIDTRFSGGLFLYIERCSAVWSPAYGVIRGPLGELPIQILHGAFMERMQQDRCLMNDQLQLELYLGELSLSLDDLIALRNGDTLACPLPSRMRALVCFAGHKVAEGVLVVRGGEISLECTQLSDAANDISRRQRGDVNSDVSITNDSPIAVAV